MNTVRTLAPPTVTVLGSGPAGLSSAAHLQHRGARVTVLEKGGAVAQAWASRYRGLRFNTSRTTSALLGHPFPRSFGRFPTRDQYVRYLRDFCREQEIEVRTGCTATRIDPAEEGWSVTTSAGPVLSEHVVVATGPFNAPVWPEWAVGSPFRGQIVHAAHYQDPAPFVGRHVLVVGAGSTGMEIAHEAAVAGAAEVTLSVRTPPTLLLREFRGMAGDVGAPLMLHLPAAIADAALRSLSAAMVGDLAPYGLPVPTEGAMTSLRRRGAGIAVVDPEVIEAIREERIRVRPAVVELGEHSARLSDGSDIEADSIVVATGYSSGLAPLIGHLGVLDIRGLPRDGRGHELLPGLRCLGYVARPGLTGYDSRLARRMARELCSPAGARPRRRRLEPAPT
ncbi:flavin-containing monooxygenase [Brachybacterium vulturis]|uniref:flavin-containing monooxygenase n=1 Tax=Brachybacterium vulturis TaxID=2017484 RepID=UPI00373676AB